MRDSLYKALARAARDNQRSLSAEIEDRLARPIAEDRIIAAVTEVISRGVGQMTDIALEALTPEEAKIHWKK